MKKLFELELTRNDVTPAQFLAYVRRMCKAHGIDCFELSARDFAEGDHWGNEYWNTRYVGGTPSTRPCESEICKGLPYDRQVYIRNFDGTTYNEIVEFTFDDEKTGHGYFYTVQTETDDEHRAEDTRNVMESIINYHRNMIAANEHKIECKRRQLAEIERNIENGWAGDHAPYLASSVRFDIEHLEHENADRAAAIEEAEAEIEKITEAAAEAENAAKHTPEMDKVLTYAELIALARKHYNEGGDGIVECWSERDFDEYVKECGPVTMGIAFSIMEVHDVDIKAEINALFGGESETATRAEGADVVETVMGLRVEMIEGTDIRQLVSNDGGYTTIGPIAQMRAAGYLDGLDEDEAAELDDSKWLVIDMVDMYQVDSLEEAMQRIKSETQTFKIEMVSMGGTRRDMFTGLTFERAHELCEDYGWAVSPDGPGGYEWDLEIVEEENG